MTTPNVTNVTNESEAGAVARIVERHIKPEVIKVDHPESADDGLTQVLAVPKGIELHSVKKFFDEYRTAPERRAGTANFQELASLVAHANRFKDKDSALFASVNPHGSTLTSVLDYHRQNEGEGEGSPRFGKHRGLYAFPASDEWEAWTEQDGKPLEQAEFAAFLEDRIQDVADPDGAFASAKKFAEALGIPQFASPSKLLELSRGLTVHVGDKVTNKIDLGSGEVTMHFETTHTDGAGGPVKVPRAFLVQIPVFRAGQLYQLAVRLRYRASGGRVTWSYDINGADRAHDDAFREACELAAEQTALPLFYGTPET